MKGLLYILPWMGTQKIIKMDDIEIVPFNKKEIELSFSLTDGEMKNLDGFVDCFFINSGAVQRGLEKNTNFCYIKTIKDYTPQEMLQKLEQLFCCLKFHNPIDFINYKFFNSELFSLYAFSGRTNIPNDKNTQNTVYSGTTPLILKENRLHTLYEFYFTPLESLFDITGNESLLKILSGSQDVISCICGGESWEHIIDLTPTFKLFPRTKKFNNFLKILFEIHKHEYGNINIYCSLIATLIEIACPKTPTEICHQCGNSGDKIKESCVIYGKELDERYLSSQGARTYSDKYSNLGFFAYGIAKIYSLRCDFSHEGKVRKDMDIDFWTDTKPFPIFMFFDLLFKAIFCEQCLIDNISLDKQVQELLNRFEG